MSKAGLSTIGLLLLASTLSATTLEEAVALGRKALKNNGVATAWKIAQALLLERPDSAVTHEFAAEVLFRRGDFTEAEDQFKRALKIHPDFARAWWGLGRIEECSSMYETAERYFRRAHDEDPKDPQIFREWALRLNGQEHLDAMEKYAAMIEGAAEQDELQSTRQHIQLDRTLKGRNVMILSSPYQNTELPLIDVTNAGAHMRSYGLEITVNGERLTLVLDTGASGILIQQRAAERAGVDKIADASFGGIGDNVRRATGYTGVAGRVKIGSVEYQDAIVHVSEKDLVGYADGLIGTDAFSAFLIELDFPGKKMKLSAFPDYKVDSSPRDRTPSSAGFVPVFRFGHMLLLPTKVNDAPERLFVIDSGSARTMISYDLAAELSHIKRDDSIRMSGVSGQVADLYATGTMLLQFAGFRQKNLGITAFDMREQSRRLGTELSGFIGLPLLNLFRLTINYRDGVVKFEFPG
jgi:Tfp pilus assembly protein PilF